MQDKEKHAQDFAISVIQDYLSKHDLKFIIRDVSKLESNDSTLFDLYYVAYYGFLASLKNQEKKNLKDRLASLASLIHSKHA